MDFDNKELRELRLRFAGTDDFEVLIKKVSQQTGWKEHHIGRWEWDYLHDVIRILLSEKVQTDRQYDRAIFLSNEGMTWPEITVLMTGNRDDWKTYSQCVKRYDKNHHNLLKAKKHGRRSKLN